MVMEKEIMPRKRKTIKRSYIKKGSTVKLRTDVLVKHARGVPSHAGYTHAQFQWRDTLRKLKGKTGKVTRTFKTSEHVNVQFGKTLIGINKSQLRKFKARKQSKKTKRTKRKKR